MGHNGLLEGGKKRGKGGERERKKNPEVEGSIPYPDSDFLVLLCKTTEN